MQGGSNGGLQNLFLIKNRMFKLGTYKYIKLLASQICLLICVSLIFFRAVLVLLRSTGVVVRWYGHTVMLSSMAGVVVVRWCRRSVVSLYGCVFIRSCRRTAVSTHGCVVVGCCCRTVVSVYGVVVQRSHRRTVVSMHGTYKIDHTSERFLEYSIMVEEL
jgi:hypothetical protein